MADAKTVVVKLRIEPDTGSARREMRALADDTAKAAAGQRQLNQRGGSTGPDVGRLADRFQERYRQQQAVQAELVRRGVLAGPKPAPTTADLVNQAAEWLQQQQSRPSARGWSPAG